MFLYRTGMNVVVPTAMISRHKDQILSLNSAKIAMRAQKVLSSLVGSANVARHGQAILAVTGNSDDNFRKSNANKDLIMVSFCKKC